MLVNRVFRRLNHGSSGILPIPDNVPTVAQNNEWLRSLPKEKSGLESHISTQGQSFSFEGEFPGSIKAKVSSFPLSSSPFSSLNVKQRPRAEQPFSDLRVVQLRSGKGGSGNVSFFSDTGVAVGPPDGGDGGNGGDVYVMAYSNLSSLHHLKSKYSAKDGGNGRSGQLDGKKGDDVIINVPVGTTVKWCPDPNQLRKHDQDDNVWVQAKAGLIQLFRNSFLPGDGWLFKDKSKEYHLQKEYFNELNDKVTQFDKQLDKEELDFDTFPVSGIDLDKPSKDPILLLKGGKSGMGNMHFLTTNIRNPRFSKMGRSAIGGSFIFELKLLADLGLVGLPNAGKSTLLRAISNATPRVGHWEFTTLQPTIGTIQLRIDQPPFSVADIPGIVKDAQYNRGLGLNFLRHVERSGGIVFVISLGSKSPIDDLEVLIEELGPRRMRDKNVLVVATKADLEGSEERFRELKDFTDEKVWKVVPCCAMNKENVQTVVQLMAECSVKKKQKSKRKV